MEKYYRITKTREQNDLIDVLKIVYYGEIVTINIPKLLLLEFYDLSDHIYARISDIEKVITDMNLLNDIPTLITQNALNIILTGIYRYNYITIWMENALSNQSIDYNFDAMYLKICTRYITIDKLQAARVGETNSHKAISEPNFSIFRPQYPSMDMI